MHTKKLNDFRAANPHLDERQSAQKWKSLIQEKFFVEMMMIPPNVNASSNYVEDYIEDDYVE